jgi:hypothetical protein
MTRIATSLALTTGFFADIARAAHKPKILVIFGDNIGIANVRE